MESDKLPANQRCYTKQISRILIYNQKVVLLNRNSEKLRANRVATEAELEWLEK